jgi:hypothetical protein
MTLQRGPEAADCGDAARDRGGAGWRAPLNASAERLGTGQGICDYRRGGNEGDIKQALGGVQNVERRLIGV